ncbi:IS3 family transposase [Rothia nasisuis]|uniref:IS3 family transposase n=1 Tax=Rothia nasisuis TaxID=2109647 RepID=UPI0034DF320E
MYGVRTMWHALRREGIDIGREQTARLMRLAGVAGKGVMEVRLLPPVSLACLMCARTWSIVRSKPRVLVSCGWLILLTCARGKGLCRLHLLLMCSSEKLLVGLCRIRCGRKSCCCRP